MEKQDIKNYNENQEQHQYLTAEDVVPEEMRHNLDNITNEEAIAIFDRVIANFQEKGGEPFVWKKPHYLLVAPILLIITVFIFILRFQPTWEYTTILVLGSFLFAYIRYEEWATQHIEIYPYMLRYTYKQTLFKVKTVELMFGTSHLVKMELEPYGAEQVWGWTKFFNFFKPRRWMKSSNIYIYNSDGYAIVIPYVYQCELFYLYIGKKITDYLRLFDKKYQTKHEYILNGHVYESKEGVLVDNEELDNIQNQ